MTIYGEYLFLENFITGLVILFFTGKIIGKQPGKVRYVTCGICCGAYVFVLFLPVGGILSLAGKFLFSAVMTTVAFGKTSVRRTLQNSGIFLGVSVLYGGIAIALLSAFGWIGITDAAGVYLPPLTYCSVTLLASAAAALMWALVEAVKVKRLEMRTEVTAEVCFDRKKRLLRGMIDSGNSLTEPLTGKAVCIVRRSLMNELLEQAESPELRYTVIPYRAVGTAHGMLEGYRMDALTVEGRCVKNPVLAVCEEEQFFSGRESPEILLPKRMLERGIYEDC